MQIHRSDMSVIVLEGNSHYFLLVLLKRNPPVCLMIVFTNLFVPCVFLWNRQICSSTQLPKQHTLCSWTVMHRGWHARHVIKKPSNKYAALEDRVKEKWMAWHTWRVEWHTGEVWVSCLMYFYFVSLNILYSFGYNPLFFPTSFSSTTEGTLICALFAENAHWGS